MKNKSERKCPKTLPPADDPELRMIRALLRKPMHERMNWLRKRLPGGGSCV